MPDAMPPRVAIAYQHYRDMGPRRSLRGLVSTHGHKFSNLRRWSVRYGWPERAGLHDLEEARQVDPERVSLAMRILQRARREADEASPAQLRALIASASMLLPPPAA